MPPLLRLAHVWANIPITFFFTVVVISSCHWIFFPPFFERIPYCAECVPAYHLIYLLTCLLRHLGGAYLAN